MKLEDNFVQHPPKESKPEESNTSSELGLSESDQLLISNLMSKPEGSSVKGKVICLPGKDKFGVDDFPEQKDEVGFHLAIALEDEENLTWYQKLARERRSDFLKNCLRATLQASEQGSIRKTKAAYFVGVVKARTFQQERLKEYKKKHYEHTTLYGYGRKAYEK